MSAQRPATGRRVALMEAHAALERAAGLATEAAQSLRDAADLGLADAFPVEARVAGTADALRTLAGQVRTLRDEARAVATKGATP